MTKNNFRILVVIPSYNHADYLEEAIMSVLNQTYKNYKFIVIDDASIDNSSEIIIKLAEKFGFEYIIQKENTSVPKVLNRAINLFSDIEYLACCASDDKWIEDKLEKQISYMDTHQDVAACSGNMLFIDSKGKKLEIQNINKQYCLNFKDVFVYGRYLNAPATILRMKPLEKIGFFDERFDNEDMIWLKLTEANYKICSLEDIFTYYRRHGNNFSSDHKKMMLNLNNIYQSYRNHFLYNKAIKNYYNRQFNYYSRRNKKLAFYYLIRMKGGFFRKSFIKSLFFFLIPNKITQFLITDEQKDRISNF